MKINFLESIKDVLARHEYEFIVKEIKNEIYINVESRMFIVISNEYDDSVGLSFRLDINPAWASEITLKLAEINGLMFEVIGDFYIDNKTIYWDEQAEEKLKERLKISFNSDMEMDAYLDNISDEDCIQA